MKIERYMSIHKLTDTALAARVGVFPTTVMRWRKNETRPEWDIIPAIIAATEGIVTANDFIPAPAPNGAEPPSGYGVISPDQRPVSEGEARGRV